MTMKIDYFLKPGFLGLSLMLAFSSGIFAQKKVGFNGQQLEMAELKANDKSAIAGKAFGGKKLVVVEGNPEAFGKGLALGNNRFLISIPEQANGKELFNAGIQSWAPVSAGGKISAELKSKIRNPRGGVMEVYILCIPGTDEKQIRAAWIPAWGSIKDVWTGDNLLRLTISANPAQIKAISEEGWSMQLEESEGEIIPHNQVASDNGRINTIANAGFGWSSGLTGKNVSVGVGDGGLVDYHADLESHQFNLVTTKLSSFADHPDHVSGTIGGLGLINPDRKGIAPAARILNHQTSNIISNAPSLRLKENVTLTNNSYGNTLICSKSGLYNSTSSMMDGQIVSYPDLLHVVSAGNSGTSTCSPYPATFFNMAEGYPASKNSLIVGAVTFGDGAASWSAKGPLRDGRLKPEIVANGNEIFSTVPSDLYGIKSGTSQAAPVLTGTLALLTERYRDLRSGQNPEAALLKALVCNTADDLGLANADFTYGFGRLNARKARRVLEASQFSSNSITSNTSKSFNLTVPAGVTSLKIMLAWTDPAAAASPAKALINDLNLSVVRTDGSVTLPWVANPSTATVAQAAQRGIDSLNNMEQVTLTVSPGEVLSIRTSSKSISGSSQKYWIVYDWVRPELVLTAPQHNQMLRTATSFLFRWDASGYTFSSLILETSTDSITWTTAQTVAGTSSLFSTFTPTGTTFRKAWFRYRGVSAGQNIFSNAVKITLSPQPAATVSVCDRNARISWAAVSGATRYEFFKLNRSNGTWDSQGITTGLVAYFGGLENGKKEILAVRPWFGNEPGMRSLGVAATPAAGVCPWTKDLGISRLLSPASGRLFTSSAPVSTIQLEIQNYANTAASAQACTLNYRKPDGSLQQFPLNLSIGAGLKQNYMLPISFNNTQAGTQKLRFWLSTSGDLNAGNDSLSADIKVLANNPERTFPLSLNFEAQPSFNLNAGSLGMSGEERMDFNSTNQARAMSSIKNPPATFGSRSLILDKERVDSRTGTGEAIFTFNLSPFPSPKELKLSFDIMSFGSALASGNNLSFRPSDQAAWILLKNFSQESFIAGVPKNFSNIDLLSLLAGTSPSSSFQLRFSFSGQRNSEIDTRGGYAIDNIIITLPSTDVKAGSLTLSPDNCYRENENRPIKLQVQNTGLSAVQNVLVSYQVNGFAPVTDTLSSLAASETKTHTFSRGLSSSQFGKVNIRAWVSSPGDGNTANDSLPLQSALHYKIITQYPYYESFESNAASWVAQSSGNQSRWEWGAGLGKSSAIDTAANGSKFWYSNPGFEQNQEELSYLQSPCFDLSQQGDMQISFHSAYRLNGENEQAWLEVSQDGQEWTKAGNSGSGSNWYNEGSDNWGNGRTTWQPSGLKIPQGSYPANGRLRFRLVYKQAQGNSGQGFALDDIHMEAASDVDMTNTLDESEESSIPSAWLSFGKEGSRAAMVQNNPATGILNVQMHLHQDGIRAFADRYYLDRNFLFLPQTAAAAPQKIRLFIADAEVKRMMEADRQLSGFQQLGVFRYNGPNRDFTPENNDFSQGIDFAFLPPADLLKVPTYGGFYLEFLAPGLSEFYICRQGLADNNPNQGFRLSASELPPHQPVEVKWLTPLDDNAGRELDRKIAWMDPASETLYLDGLNGAPSRIRLLDLKGQLLIDESFNGYKFETRTSGLAKGLYTLRVEQESGVETFRVMLD